MHRMIWKMTKYIYLFIINKDHSEHQLNFYNEKRTLNFKIELCKIQ